MRMSCQIRYRVAAPAAPRTWPNGVGEMQHEPATNITTLGAVGHAAGKLLLKCA